MSRFPLKVARSMLVTTVAIGFVVAAAIAQAAPNPCAAGKDKCVGKKAAAILKCYAKADKQGLTPGDLSTCIFKARVKFEDPTTGCFPKLEAKFGGACLTTGDAGVVEAKVDTFTTAAFCALHPADPTCACQATTGGFCWFLGSPGEDCDGVCADAGRLYDEATRTYAGSDGTDANCQAVATALGSPAFVGAASSGGLGCYLGVGGFCGGCVFRDTDVTSTSDAGFSNTYRVCACR